MSLDLNQPKIRLLHHQPKLLCRLLNHQPKLPHHCLNLICSTTPASTSPTSFTPKFWSTSFLGATFHRCCPSTSEVVLSPNFKTTVETVLVHQGHDESKNALRLELVNVKEGEWSELSGMSEKRDECEGVVIRSEFWAVSGYEMETQEAFKSSAEVYDIGKEEWRRVEGAWPVSR